MKKVICLLTLLVTFSINAQYGSRDSNRIGISGGITQMSLFSDQFNAKPETGWIGGFSLRGNYYNDWQMAFGMNFTESNFSLQSVLDKDINYKMSAVQIYLTGSYMIIENHLTFEIGPVLQINGKLAIDEEDELKLLKDSPLITAKDITDITKINGNIYAGITAGIKNVRLHVSYQYGVNNFMNNLNKSDELKLLNGNEKFKANYGILSGMITFYL
ncbi:PorT family protein [Flavobacterium sediminilitoris]|uniref:PorT family protein n=1 Tax=Flavobacterium sediminilitoris TaxID=2024526 RepID=A0ABY4HQK7_9FLAO|nr:MULTISPECIES: PorT family protein [Flavobacterium]UOX34911.1 PorT family protein [Flavobacterium sediminilitoris]